MIEYLVAHELAHLVEREHIDAFWLRLERLVPDYAERRRWLEEEGAVYDL
jgi:predicted metal-dependent hydrolase